MAFNIKINAYIAGKDTIPLGEYSNCSSIVLKKIDILSEESLTNGVLVNNLYKIKYTVTPESGVPGDPGYINKTYTSPDDSSIYFLTKIYAYDLSENVVIGSVKNLIDEINNNESGAEIIYYQNIELKCIYEKKIPVCVTTNNKYYGDPWILYGDENSNTIKVKEISIDDDCEKFWICENKTSYEAVDFDYWNIKIHQVIFKSGNIEDNIHTSQTINKGDSKLLNLATVTFNLDVNNSDMNLYLVRNENVLSLNNLKKLDIYSTFNTCIGTIENTLEELQSEDPTIESIGYYLELTACYSPNNVWITVRKRNGEPQYLKKYLFGSDISDEYINAPKRGGYVFDGFYINPNTKTNDLDEVPGDDETLGSNYIRVTDSTGKFIPTATDFLDEYHYINPVDYKYVIANYRKAKTTVKLDWQINGKGYTKDGKTYTRDNEEKIIAFKDDLSNHKIKDIPTNLKVKQNGVDVDLTFMGFYTLRDGWGDKVIKADGKFKTDLLSWTSGNRWISNRFSTSDDEITLYAFWASGSYIELDKVSGTGGSNSFDVKYGENMYNHALTKPKRYIDNSDTTSGELIFNGYWVDDYETRVTWNGGGFIINKKKKDGTKLTNTLNQWLLQKPITLYAYWYSKNYQVYANSNMTGCTAKVNGKDKVNYKQVGDTVNLTVSYDKLRFNFNGWTVYDGTKISNTNESVSRTISLGDVNSSDNRIDYNANFEHRKYSIYYKDSDDYQYGRHTFYYDSYLKNLLKPQKAGYKFIGWFTDKALTNQVTYINEGNGGNGEGQNGANIAKTNLTSNGAVQEITLYAKWEKINIEGKFILKPGKGAWKTGVNPPESGTIIVYGSAMTQLHQNYFPELNDYSFSGYYDKDSRLVINKNGDWIKNTRYVDQNGNSIMTDTYEFTAKFSKIKNFIDEFAQMFEKELNCNITVHSNIDFKKSIENKIATTNWINTAIGIPEINYYDDLIKNFYNTSMVETYNSNKGMADRYFFNDFDFDNNKLLKQSDIIDFFDNSATKLENVFYLKDVIYDTVNNKTIMSANFIENNALLYPSGYNGSKDTVIYFTINDDKSVVYKLNIDEIKGSPRIETTLQYFDIEFPHLTDYINKITIEHICCFAIDNLNDTRTYYKPYLVFNKFTDLDLTVEKNTILNNIKIKEYSSDELIKEPNIDEPSIPIVDKEDKNSPYVTFRAEEANSTIGLERLGIYQTLEYSTDKSTWSPMDTSTTIKLDNVDDEIYIRGILSNDLNIRITESGISSTIEELTNFKMTGKIASFGNCNAIWNYQDLNAPLKIGCGYDMFRDCTSLTTAPELPNTTLTDCCYTNMFNGCSSLLTAPALPSTTLTDCCYWQMFFNCSSLTTAPELPSTELTKSCYLGMFSGCSSLTTAPELPATTLVNGCYEFMFLNCTKLNYIKCLATNIPTYMCIYDWVKGVANTGTFIKHPDMNNWSTGTRGIPEGWTVEDAEIQ